MDSQLMTWIVCVAAEFSFKKSLFPMTRCEINHQSQNSPKLCEEDIPQLIAKEITENSSVPKEPCDQ